MPNDYGQYSTPAELSAIFGENSFSGNDKMYEQMQLADQFRKEAYQQQQNATREGTLKNQQSEQMNPLLLDERRGLNTSTGLENVGKNTKNQSDQLLLERQQANQQNVLNEDQRKAALAAPEHEIAMMDKKIELGLRHPDPAVRSQALELQSWLPSILAERRKHTMEMDKQKEITRSHLEGIKQQGQAQLDLSDRNAENGKWAPKSGNVSITANLMSGKLKTPEMLNVAHGMLTTGMNPDTRQPLSDMEKAYVQAMYDQGAATTEGALFLKAQGIQPTVGANGKISIENKPKPSVRSSPRGAGTSADPIVLK